LNHYRGGPGGISRISKEEARNWICNQGVDQHSAKFSSTDLIPTRLTAEDSCQEWNGKGFFYFKSLWVIIQRGFELYSI
jgi:hypothetical protein